MHLDVVLGLQWGDEGKGKIIDVLAPNYPVVARFQGGPNAGHSLHNGEQKFVTHNIPSGVLHKTTVNVIGNGVVLDPLTLQEEAKGLEAMGIPVYDKVYIAKKAHLILPTHRLVDAALEAAKGKSKIGSTLKGIGPAYTDKTARNGLRVGDSLSPDFMDRYRALKEKHRQILRQFDYPCDVEQEEARWMQSIETLKRFRLIDSEYYLNRQLNSSVKILAEGAQGTMLDMDYGSYPFVTSSTAICSGACTGLGIAPTRVGKVYGIFKAYCTRVGAGPFPTELFDETAEKLRVNGQEFGATTGRPRRTGWIDLVALKYSVMLNGVTALIMMKADVMDTFDTVKACVAYKINGEETRQVPFDTLSPIEPVYKEFKGWKRNLSAVTKEEELPFEFMVYVRFIEKELGVPIVLLSLGPDRAQTVFRTVYL